VNKSILSIIYLTWLAPIWWFLSVEGAQIIIRRYFLTSLEYFFSFFFGQTKTLIFLVCALSRVRKALFKFFTSEVKFFLINKQELAMCYVFLHKNNWIPNTIPKMTVWNWPKCLLIQFHSRWRGARVNFGNEEPSQ